MRHINPLPLVYFNRATFSVYGLPGESEREAMGRVALSVDPDAVILPGRRKFTKRDRLLNEEMRDLPGFRGEIVATEGGGYGAILYSRIAAPSDSRYSAGQSWTRRRKIRIAGPPRAFTGLSVSVLA